MILMHISSVITESRSSLDKLRYIRFNIAEESHSIMNVTLRSLSVNYGSVY